MKTGEARPFCPRLWRALPECVVRQGCSRHYRQRLPLPAVMPAGLRPLYEFLGIERWLLLPFPGSAGTSVTPTAAIITYGTNNEFGFDYLRDNMAFSIEDNFPARTEFVPSSDEVDSILIDEAAYPVDFSAHRMTARSCMKPVNKLIPSSRAATWPKEARMKSKRATTYIDEKPVKVELNDSGHSLLKVC